MSNIQAIPNTDPLFTDAARAVVHQQKSSLHFLLVELQIGHTRAQRILDELEQAKILGPYHPDMLQRAILVPDLAQLEEFLNGMLC